jgi:YfiH family protein
MSGDPAPLRRPAGPLPSGVALGFTTRAGGASTGPLATLNLARHPDDVDANVAENWNRAARALHPTLSADRVALLHQVHGGDVVVVDAPRGPLDVVAKADAAVTARRDVVLAVRVADCVPVILASEAGVGVAHAGWRGTAADVVPRAVAALRDLVGDAPIVAVIGPCIGADVYEVGDEVVTGIAATGVPTDVFVRTGPRGRPHADLRAAVAHQLGRVGVFDVRHVAGETTTDPELWSFRRHGAASGRFAGIVARCG